MDRPVPPKGIPEYLNVITLNVTLAKQGDRLEHETKDD